MLPAGICVVVLLAGLILRRRWIGLTGLIVLAALSTDLAARLLIEPLQGVYPPKSISECPTADAIVVLSGDMVRGITAPGIQWGDAANRYFSGVNLALAGKARVLVFTGGPINGSPDRTEGGVLRQVAIGQGIAPDRVDVTGIVWTTADEARAVSALPGLHSIVLVTSAFHMPRAAMLFRAQGLRVIPFPTDQRYIGTPTPLPLSLIPTANGLCRSDEALREYYGLAVYRILLFFRRAPARQPNRSVASYGARCSFAIGS